MQLSDCTSKGFSKFTPERTELPQHAALLAVGKTMSFFSKESTVHIWHHRVLPGRGMGGYVLLLARVANSVW